MHKACTWAGSRSVLHQDCFHANLGLLDWLSKADFKYERCQHAVDFLPGLLITAPLQVRRVQANLC